MIDQTAFIMSAPLFYFTACSMLNEYYGLSSTLANFLMILVLLALMLFHIFIFSIYFSLKAIDLYFKSEIESSFSNFIEIYNREGNFGTESLIELMDSDIQRVKKTMKHIPKWAKFPEEVVISKILDLTRYILVNFIRLIL